MNASTFVVIYVSTGAFMFWVQCLGASVVALTLGFVQVLRDTCPPEMLLQERLCVACEHLLHRSVHDVVGHRRLPSMRSAASLRLTPYPTFRGCFSGAMLIRRVPCPQQIPAHAALFNEACVEYDAVVHDEISTGSSIALREQVERLRSIYARFLQNDDGFPRESDHCDDSSPFPRLVSMQSVPTEALGSVTRECYHAAVVECGSVAGHEPGVTAPSFEFLDATRQGQGTFGMRF